MDLLEDKLFPLIHPLIKDSLYLIDKNGQIYSFFKKDYLKSSLNKDGYKTINLRGKDGGAYKMNIATLVAYTF